MKKIKVSVLEFDYHPEVLRNTCKILNNDEFIVHIFTTHKIWNETNININDFEAQINVDTVETNKQSIKSFLQNSLKTINNTDTVLINTVASNYKTYWKTEFKPPVVLRIHNANAFFNQFYNSIRPKLSLFYIWKDVSHLVRKSILSLDWYHRKKLINKTDYFAFPNNEIKEYAVNMLNLDPQKALSLPFSFATDTEPAAKSNQTGTTTISIIGKVDKRNRDYMTVYEAFKHIQKSSTEIKENIKLVLLGKATSAYGKSIAKKFRQLQNNKFEFIYFDSFVPQETFERIIDQTDFFIVPTNIKTRFAIYEEYYGYTKISGSINDIIRHKKPALVYADYPLSAALKKITEGYKNDLDLAEKIKDWINRRKYEKMNIDAALEPMKLHNVQSHYKNTFEKISNS